MSEKKELQGTPQGSKREERVERRSFLKKAGAAAAFGITGFAFTRPVQPDTWYYYHGGAYPTTTEFSGQECPCTCYCTCTCTCGCICFCWCTCPSGGWSTPNAEVGIRPWIDPFHSSQYGPYYSPLENPRVTTVAADEAGVFVCR
ncbi:MAG: twin-arginine translocation signal domain-containing protein [bacterium]